MRENPWHIRRATHRHEHWYRNLIELHSLTLGWLRELRVDRPSHFLGLSVTPEMRDSLRKIDEVAHGTGPGESLDTLLDDTSPDDLLTRLETTVQTVQAITLKSLWDRMEPQGRPLLSSQLEQISWSCGRESGLARWPRVSRAAIADLRGILAAFRGNALQGSGEQDPWLIRRAVSEELLAELRICPHQSSNAAVLMVADPLCSLYAAWSRGFAYALNSRVVIEQTPGPRCLQRWFLHA